MRKFALVKTAKDRNEWKKKFGSEEYDKEGYGHTYRQPCRATSRSAGYDFYSPIDLHIPAKGRLNVPTGFKAYMQPDEFLLLAIRSSYGDMGMELVTNSAIIDADYADNPTNEGEIIIRIKNTTDKPFDVKRGERVAQGVFMKYLTVEDDMPSRPYRSGPSGSTGK